MKVTEPTDVIPGGRAEMKEHETQTNTNPESRIVFVSFVSKRTIHSVLLFRNRRFDTIGKD